MSETFKPRKFNMQTVVWKEGEYYIAQSLRIDVSSFGLTRREALTHLDEALALYFEGGESEMYHAKT